MYSLRAVVAVVLAATVLISMLALRPSRAQVRPGAPLQAPQRFGLAGAKGEEAAKKEVTAEQVRNAIDRAVSFLKKEQQPSGQWDDFGGRRGGVTCLCALALLNAGVPLEDASMQRA